MKFYRNKKYNNYIDKIIDNNLTSIHSSFYCVQFLKNGKISSNKNTSYISFSGYKLFSLNGVIYGNQNDFTKSSWRKFAKLKAFL